MSWTPMRRLYARDPLRHFLVWLALYLGIDIIALNLESALDLPGHTVVAIPLAMLAVVITIYLVRSGVGRDIGLGVRPAVSLPRLWFYLPLVVLVALPLSTGVRADLTVLLIVAMVVHYVASGYLEEVLFRGLLLTHLLREWPATSAILLSALTFGLGHATSMLADQSGADTIWQVINPTVVGLLFTLVVVATGSLTAVIVAHVFYNIIAESAQVPDGLGVILTGLAVLAVYGPWLLYGAGGLTRLREDTRTSGAPVH
ncbi:CPBP family intramembrane glutamic endopeptidase [Dietzia lutea]|nr:CPBP family intramembrane glutamic endopeptidase [Dietzia lutea]